MAKHHPKSKNKRSEGHSQDLTDFKNCTIYLIGFPGVGKLSIGREICRQADFRLIDSHMINKLVFPFVRETGNGYLPSAIWAATRKIRKVVLDTMVTIGKRDFNFVFTNSLLEGQPEDLKIFRLIERSLRSRDGCLIPVRITCKEEEHRKRIVSPDREAELKLMDPDRVGLFHEISEPLKPKHPHTIEIEVANVSAAEAAQQILDDASTIYRDWARINLEKGSQSAKRPRRG